MKEIYFEEFNKKIKDIIFDNKNDLIKFIFEDNKEFILESYHEPDCCENVYADFSVILYHKDKLIGEYIKIHNITITVIQGMGFILKFNFDSSYEIPEKILVPCYNAQNGYYSDNLELIINNKTRIDLSEYKEDVFK